MQYEALAARFRTKRHRGIRVLMALLIYASALTSGAADLRETAAAVDAHYNHLHSLQADFTETYRGAGIDRTESGTLWLKKPGKMRWEYRSPVEKVFVSDGKDAWFYVPGERQARRTDVKKLEDLRSPLALLLGKTKLQRELTGLSFAPDIAPLQAGNVVLRGIPQAIGDRVSQILLEINSASQIERIVIEGVDESTTEYRISNQKEDVPVADQQFHFKTPEGVEVVTGDFGQ